MNTIPETPEAIAAQLQWLVEGKRRAVLLTPGTPLPELPEEVCVLPSRVGLWVYNPNSLTPAEIEQHILENKWGLLLGYGIASKPEGGVCVVIRGPDGREKQSVVVPACQCQTNGPLTPYGEAIAAARAMAGPADSVTVETAAGIIKERTDELDRHELTYFKFDEGRDGGDLRRLCGEHPGVRSPHCPSWSIRLNGQLVGAVGVNSLPLFHLWLPVAGVTLRQSRAALSFIENSYRLAGVTQLAGIVDVDCNSYPFKERLGYTELSDERICFKQL